MLLAQISRSYEAVIAALAKKNIFNYKLGIARTTLALSTFLTILTNDPLVLFKNGDIFNVNTFDKELYIFQKINFFALFGSDHIYVAQCLALLILLVVISGWRPRFTCIFHFWICVSFNYATVLIEGGDQIASNLSLMLIPLLLMDGRKWHWQNLKTQFSDGLQAQKSLVANYFHMIIKLQMCLIYFHAAVGKLPNKDWANGTAVYYWFNDPVFGMNDWMHMVLDPVLSNSFGVSFLTWGTIFLEILLFMAIIMNDRAKWVLFFFGITFHLGIIFIHGLVSFFFSMAGGLMLYLWIDNKYGKIRFLEEVRD